MTSEGEELADGGVELEEFVEELERVRVEVLLDDVPRPGHLQSEISG